MLPLTASKPERSGILSDLLRPLPVFFIVTLITGPIYGIPTFQEVMGAVTVFTYNSTAVLLHLLLPPATGLLASLGVYLGRTERFSKTRTSDESLPDGSFGAEDRVRAILRSVPLAIITISPDRKTTLKNPAAQNMFFQASGKDRDPAINFIEETGLQSLMDRVFEGNSITVEEANYKPGDGTGTHILKINGIPVMRNNNVVEALLIIEDVTSWKLLEEDLIRSEERYRNIFNHAHCGIFFVDRNGNYLDANPTALEMLGYTHDELLTLNTREISSGSESRIGRLESSPGWIVEETRYLRKDGKVVEAELAGTSFRSGEDTYFIGIVKDLTRRKQLERQISAILGETEKAVVIFDSEGRITNASSGAAALLGISTENLTGHSVEDLAPGCGIDPGLMPFDKHVDISLGELEGTKVRVRRLSVDPEGEEVVVLLEKVKG